MLEKQRAGMGMGIALFAVCVAGANVGDTDPARRDGAKFYRDQIEPVLVSECYRCHSAGAKQLRGNLRLDSRAAMLQGGDTGPAVVPGKAGESLILQAIRHRDGLEMPPKKPRLPASVIANFEVWISMGAPGPPVDPSSESRGGLDLARRHWAFQPLRQPPIPPTKEPARVRNPVDAFVLARLQERGWPFAASASRTEWIRRVTFDLTGLPPTPDEVESYERDSAVDADTRLVDRLLSSPRYGEHWAQHWLDVVRYAETEGYEYDRSVPDSWRFRDYVIDSLNRDKPFDRFLTEQIAGDEIGPDDPECQIASIFHRLGPVRRNAGNPEIALSRNEVLTERTDIIGSAFLGLTIGCARCHNHKLEPVSQKDYYRLQAYVAATEENNINLAPEAEFKAWEAKTHRLKNQIARLKQKLRAAGDPERKRLAQEIEALNDAMPPPPPTIPAIKNDISRRTRIRVLQRGIWENQGEPVAPRPPSVLVLDAEPELPADVRDPRTRLARWLTSSEHPLTPRVIVNRIWAHHFGMGLVKTVNDFGTHGERPSHPELLDWLAASFVRNGWRLKPLHRMIVLSNAYRQSGRSPVATDAERSDPENRLLWRFSRRRLTAEEIRDAMLAVSRRLNPKPGGPSVIVPVDPELVKLLYKPSQWQVTTAKAEHDRRTIYLLAKRNLRLPFMEAFDAPALQSSCSRRESSTHAPQALELLNGRLSNDLARSFASRLRAESPSAMPEAVDRAFRLALGRAPTDLERASSLAFLRDQPLEDFTLALFNVNEFLYVW
ncbi:MAG: PSD1 and planctomycete cytochrome C domain-containing protein [Isosphaeraceae bacterium]